MAYEVWKPSAEPQPAELCADLIPGDMRWTRRHSEVAIHNAALRSRWQRSVGWQDESFDYRLRQHGSRRKWFNVIAPKFYELEVMALGPRPLNASPEAHFVITPPGFMHPDGAVWFAGGSLGSDSNQEEVRSRPGSLQTEMVKCALFEGIMEGAAPRAG